MEFTSNFHRFPWKFHGVRIRVDPLFDNGCSDPRGSKEAILQDCCGLNLRAQQAKGRESEDNLESPLHSCNIAIIYIIVRNLLLSEYIPKDNIFGRDTIPYMKPEKKSFIYVDRYGNAITNISREVFESVKKERSFSILFGREDEKITTISDKYKTVAPSEKLAIFGENNLLQIAINQGEANKLLGLNLHEIIRIEFK